jgi:deoxyribose-phosphate aldolase
MMELMDLRHILSLVDHTMLSVDAVWEDIKLLCDEGIQYGTASVCLPQSYVKAAVEYVNGKIPICTVVGFPNGYPTTAVKCFEADDAIKNGADEIDMVINVGWLKDKKYNLVLEEIKAIKNICGEKILKVIVEAGLLSQEEKIAICGIISDSGADYIKTSTGFHKGGATKEDVALFAKYVKPHVKIKAAGGISSFSDAEEFIRLGVSRIGSSKLIKTIKEMEKRSS